MVEIIVTENGNVRGVFTRVISALLTDSLNGECTFQFSVISSMASEIFTGLEVQLKSDTLNYLFNVVKVSKSLSNGIAICIIECEHKSYELNNDEYKLTEFDFEGAPSECLISLLQGTSLTAGICDPTVPIKLKINRECTRRAALMQLIALCGGEIEYNGNEINIRSHRGSQDYIGIMDGKNVSDLTMETDSRSGTTNYGLTLYKNMNFSVGDNVQIVFHPFNLNVNTRIIAMSFNPYNRREISIEVGDYRPSISDNLYQMEQKTNEIRNSSPQYRWFYGAGVNGDYCNALSAFEWDDKYFVITKNPLIDGKEATGTNNFGQLRVFTKDGKSTGKTWQYVADGTLSNMTAASFWGFYVDEKTNTPLVICDSFNISYSLLALEIIKSGEDYGRYRMRFSAPTYGNSYLYSYANLIKTDGLNLPLYILPYYPHSTSSQHFFGFALGICKLCLTTINNLSGLVRKLDGQVMKITYDIVDE